MRILAVETTETMGSLAAANDANLLLELNLDPSKRSARSLAPGMRAVLEKAGWKASDVELVAVTIGPGSFTGLRVGVTAAKTFAYAAGAGILGVDTLQTIAMAAPPEVQTLWAAVDAQRGDVVAGPFHRNPEGWFEAAGPQRLIAAETWLGELPAGSFVSGPVLEKLLPALPAGIKTLEPQYWRPMAGNVARLAARLYAAGQRDDPWTMVPRYSRRTAAEEKWEAKQRAAETH